MERLIEMLEITDVLSETPEGLRTSNDGCPSPCYECNCDGCV